MFLAAYRRFPGDYEQAAGWVRVAAVHAALNVLRGERRRDKRQLLVHVVTSLPSVEDTVMDRERRADVRRVLRRLPRRSAAVLVMRHCGMSYAEIAEALGVKVGNVGILLRRAESALRKEMDQRDTCLTGFGGSTTSPSRNFGLAVPDRVTDHLASCERCSARRARIAHDTERAAQLFSAPQLVPDGDIAWARLQRELELRQADRADTRRKPAGARPRRARFPRVSLRTGLAVGAVGIVVAGTAAATTLTTIFAPTRRGVGGRPRPAPRRRWNSRFARCAECRETTRLSRAWRGFGFLGPNGARKTTVVKLLLGLARPTGGEALVLGAPLGDRKARRHIGYLPELFRFQALLTAREVLRLHCRLLGPPKAAFDEEGHRALETVGLLERGDDRVGTFLTGMQRRLGLGVALLGSPTLVVLDEPTSALDPVGRHDVREIIRALRERGSTVFAHGALTA